MAKEQEARTAKLIGSYTETSRNIDFKADPNGKGGTLTAECRKMDGSYVPSSLRYDTSNQNGALTSIPSGSYQRTSRNIQVENRPDGPYLTAESQKRDGSWIPSSIKIDLVNVDGVLVWNGQA